MLLNPFAKEFVPRKKKQSYAYIAAKDVVEVDNEVKKTDQNRINTSNWHVLCKNVNKVPEINSSYDSIDDRSCKLFVTKVDISSKMSDYWCDITAKSKNKSPPLVENKNISTNCSLNTTNTSLWHGILQSSIKYSNDVLNSNIIENKNSYIVSENTTTTIDSLHIFNKIRADDTQFISLLISTEALTIIDPVSGLDLVTFLCKFGKFEMLKMVLLLDIENMKKINYSKFTMIVLLQVAAASNDIAVFKSVIKLGDINTKCGNRETIIHKAVKENNINLLKYLLINKESSSKLNVNCRNKQGETPLFFVKSRDATIILINYGANPYIINDTNDNAFGKLVRMNKYNLLNFLLTTNSNTNNYYKQVETTKVNNPLNIASYLGFIDCIKILLQTDRYDINARDYYTNDTPLLCACRNYQSDVIKYLLSMNADPYIECSDGFPPILLVYNDIKIINIFLDNKKLIDYYSYDATFMMKLLKYVINRIDSNDTNLSTILSYYIVSFRLIVPKKALYFLIKNVAKSSSTLEILMNEKIFDNFNGKIHLITKENSNNGNIFDVIFEDITICSIGFNSTLLCCVSNVFEMLIVKKKEKQLIDALLHTHYDQKYILLFQKWLYNTYLSHYEGSSQNILLNLNVDDLIELLHFSNEFIIEALHYDCQIAFIKNNYYSKIDIDVMPNLISSLNLDLIQSYYSHNNNNNVDVYDTINNFITSNGKDYYKNIKFKCQDVLNDDINNKHFDLLLVSSDNKFIYCHKVILYSFSQKFNGMIKFYSTDTNIDSSSILTLRLGTTFDELYMLVEWMYFGRIDTTNKSLLCRLLLLADEYIINSLTNRLEILLLDIIKEDLEMIVEVLNIIYSIDTSSLNKLCIVSAALYILKYKDIVTNFDIFSNENHNINEELVVDALNLLLQ